MPGKPHVLLLAGPQESGPIAEMLSEAGLQVTTVKDLQEVFAPHLAGRKYQGMATTVAAAMQPGSKALLHLLEGIFPSARVRWAGGTVRILARTSEVVTLDDFLRVCREFPPRPVRAQERRTLCLPVRLARHADMAEAERTATLNLSGGGCFVITAQDYPVKTPVWLSFPVFPEAFAIPGEVRWCCPWGHKAPPGIGIQFGALATEQQRSFAAWAASCLP